MKRNNEKEVMLQILHEDKAIISALEKSFPKLEGKIERVICMTPGFASDRHTSVDCLNVIVELK